MMMMSVEAVRGMIGRGNRSARRKPAPVPLCSPQIPHDLTWARTRAAAVGSRRLTAWAMALPYLKHNYFTGKISHRVRCTAQNWFTSSRHAMTQRPRHQKLSDTLVAQSVHSQQSVRTSLRMSGMQMLLSWNPSYRNQIPVRWFSHPTHGFQNKHMAARRLTLEITSFRKVRTLNRTQSYV
jgi:hypothetical protein